MEYNYKEVVYNRGVIFREVKGTSRIEDVTREKELEKIEFEKNDKGHDLDELAESDEEVGGQNPIMWRSSRASKQPERCHSPKFHLAFALYTIEYYPRSLNEAVNSRNGELWKKNME